MLPVDLLQCWRIGGVVFTKWLLCLGLIARYGCSRRLTRESPARLLVFDIVASACSWAALVMVPLPIAAWIFAHWLILEPLLTIDRDHPAGWISVWLTSALLTSAVDSLILRCVSRARIRPQTFWLFVATNFCVVGAAGWAAAVFILAHPPIE